MHYQILNTFPTVFDHKLTEGYFSVKCDIFPVLRLMEKLHQNVIQYTVETKQDCHLYTCR